MGRWAGRGLPGGAGAGTWMGLDVPVCPLLERCAELGLLLVPVAGPAVESGSAGQDGDGGASSERERRQIWAAAATGGASPVSYGW